MPITSEQIRAARALIRWEQKDLAEASRVSLLERLSVLREYPGQSGHTLSLRKRL